MLSKRKRTVPWGPHLALINGNLDRPPLHTLELAVLHEPCGERVSHVPPGCRAAIEHIFTQPTLGEVGCAAHPEPWDLAEHGTCAGGMR
eukprot:3708646-Lingulodinium_polyedra.AAC.1